MTDVDRPAGTDTDFDWGDESQLHRVGRGARVVLAFAGAAFVLFAVAAALGFLFRNIWVAVGTMLLISGVVELVARVRRRRASTSKSTDGSTTSDH